MRFLHTADWQIGMKAAHTGTAGARVREARIAAAHNVVARAREAGAELIVVAGDTFEDNGVDRLLVQKIVDVLSSFPGPVLVIPGNHDPLVPGSVWEHPAWRSETAKNVNVLRSEDPVEVTGGWIFPCPLRSKHSDRDPTLAIPSRDLRGIRIGIAHGTVEGVRQDEPDYPIARDAALRAGLDYLALGHWHSFAPYEVGGAQRMAYSGTHETTKFGERASGSAVLVEIVSPGAPPTLTPMRTGTLQWVLLELESRQAGAIATVRKEIEGFRGKDGTLLEARVAGLLFPGDEEELRRITELLATGFVFGRLDATRLLLAPEADGWLERIPPGPVRAAAARLRELSSSAYSEPRPEGGTPKAAAQALLELYALLAKDAT